MLNAPKPHSMPKTFSLPPYLPPSICSELETLHHEWGHALHSLLSRTRYQHLSGTRGGTDFIEVPSHWMEHFSREASVLVQYARHHVTGEKVPLPLLQEALRGSKRFAATDLQTQLLYAAADQHLFGAEIADWIQAKGG
eukprot:CAMPEP_0173233292 /NCGR_PEP_ID=MMETSP1142-20121109/9517_1 /TAXON_ID=483371 /ORGANISM="non described non described, Strain CCMP2298" /LENGTH=138 /DNA_ID=CAMNT_0014163061 /DNA_START=121 /DNA_END=534 /DNA_ORIENTATION=+